VRAIVLRGVRLVSFVVSEWEDSLFSIIERNKDSSCHPEEKDSHQIPKTGRCEEDVDRQEIQKWSAK
jgi:hypothetical protein